MAFNIYSPVVWNPNTDSKLVYLLQVGEKHICGSCLEEKECASIADAHAKQIIYICKDCLQKIIDEFNNKTDGSIS